MAVQVDPGYLQLPPRLLSAPEINHDKMLSLQPAPLHHGSLRVPSGCVSRTSKIRGGAVQVDPRFPKLNLCSLSMLETEIMTTRFQTLLSTAACATTPRGGSLEGVANNVRLE